MDTESALSQPDSSDQQLLHEIRVEAIYEALLVLRTIKRLGSQRTPQTLSRSNSKTHCSQQWDQSTRHKTIQHMKWYSEMIVADNKLGGPCHDFCTASVEMVDLNSLQKPENVKREGVCLCLNKQADVRHGAQLSAVLYAPLIVHNPGSRLLITNQKARVTCTRSVLGNGYI